MRALIVYHSFTEQAEVIANSMKSTLAELGHEPAMCHLSFTGEAARPPIDRETISRWSKWSKEQTDRPFGVDQPESLDARPDVTFLLVNTWGFNPAVPVQSFLRSEHAEVLRGTPVAIGIVCRGFWRQNLKAVTPIVERAGAEIIDREVFSHSGSWLGSTITVVNQMVKVPPIPTRIGPLPLPPFGLSPKSEQAVSPFVTRVMAKL